MPHRAVTPCTIVALLLTLASTGCSSQRRVFPGHDPGALWTAMVAVAETPDYGGDDDRWIVKENRAYARPDERRIEVYRELIRYEDLEKVDPFADHRTFRFQILLEELNPPTVAFVSRGTGFPRHAEEEANRYFDDLGMLVGDTSAAMGPPPSGGASSPEIAVRDLLYAVYRRDEAAVRRIIVPRAGMEILWTGEPPADLATGDALDRRIIRPARVGEVIEIDGQQVRVTRPFVEGDRRVILATVGGDPLPPFEVVRVEDRWRVDVSRIIARRRRPER